MKTIQEINALLGQMVAIQTVDGDTYFGRLNNTIVHNENVEVHLSRHVFHVSDLNDIMTLKEWERARKSKEELQ